METVEHMVPLPFVPTLALMSCNPAWQMRTLSQISPVTPMHDSSRLACVALHNLGPLPFVLQKDLPLRETRGTSRAEEGPPILPCFRRPFFNLWRLGRMGLKKETKPYECGLIYFGASS